MHALLLSNSYEYLRFASERDTIRLWSRDKVEILSSWDKEIYRNFKMPAVMKLKGSIPRWYQEQKFNIKKIPRRDHFLCAFCGEPLTSDTVTIDHILPKSRGGQDSWENCVTCCRPCNHMKGSRTPEEAGMKLRFIPAAPKMHKSYYDYNVLNEKHPDWKTYLGF